MNSVEVVDESTRIDRRQNKSIITRTERVTNGDRVTLRITTRVRRLDFLPDTEQQLQSIEAVDGNRLRFITRAQTATTNVPQQVSGHHHNAQPPRVDHTKSETETVQPPVICTPVSVLRLPVRRGPQGVQLSLSENELLAAVLERSPGLLSLLPVDASTLTRTIRVAQLVSERRIFAVLTTLVTFTSSDQHIPFACIFWQVATNPGKAICITIKKDVTQTDRDLQFHFTCSCNPALSVSGSNGFECQHLSQALQNNPTTNLIRTILNGSLQHSTVGSYFAAPISEGDQYLTVQLESNTTNKPGNSKSTFFVQFDTDRLVFIPLLKPNNRFLQCLLCRGTRRRRGTCCHEALCERVISGETESATYNENDEDDDDLEFSEMARNLDSSPPSNGTTTTDNGSEDDDVWKYSLKRAKLPLLPCKGIQTATILLATQIESMKGSEELRIDDHFGVCQHCGYERKMQPVVSFKYRTVRLFTLNQHTVHVQIEDWRCPKCKDIVFFTGLGRSIFPTRKMYAYTYELLYHYLQNVCRLGISFRAQYDSCHMRSISDSARARFEEFFSQRPGLSNDIDDCQSGRRRAAEALHLFIRFIDTSNKDLCAQLFSCRSCEVPLNEEDRCQLGMLGKNVSHLRRFKALAVDGTAAGILHKLPNYRRDLVEMNVQNDLRKDTRLITSRIFNSAISTLIKIARARLRLIVSGKRNLPAGTDRLKFVLPLTETTVQLKKYKGGSKLSKESIGCLRMILRQHQCLCTSGFESVSTSSETTGQSHSAFCRKITSAYVKSISTTHVLALLRTTIEMLPQQLNMNSTAAEDVSSFLEDELVQSDQDEEEETSDDNPEELTHQDVRTNSKWFGQIAIQNPIKCSQFIESLFELILQLLLQNVAVPYIRPGILPQSGEINSQLAGVQEAEQERFFNEDGTLKYIPEALGFHPRRCLKLLVSSLRTLQSCRCITTCKLCSNCVQSITQDSSNVSNVNPVLSRCIDQFLLHYKYIWESGASICKALVDALNEHYNSAESYCQTLVEKLSPTCVDYWKKYSSSNLQQFNTGNHHPGGDQTSKNSTTRVNLDTGSADVPARPPHSSLSSADNENNGTENNNNNTTPEYHNGELNARVVDMSEETGISFPGRAQYRPMFTFDQKEAKQCGKRYPNSRNHSPGIITVQCVCSNPKLIGFVVMTRPESTALALVSVLMHLQVLPRYIFYDNACNSVASALLRLPWLLTLTLLIVDRFHYKAHSCNALYEADCYKILDRIKTSSAESINARIKRSLYHMRFLKGSMLVCYLNVRFALLNLVATFSEQTKKTDIEDVDLTKFYTSLVPCSCHSCQWESMESERIDLEAERE